MTDLALFMLTVFTWTTALLGHPPIIAKWLRHTAAWGTRRARRRRAGARPRHVLSTALDGGSW